MAGAPSVESGKNYAGTLYYGQKTYYKYTTPAERGYFIFTAKNITVDSGLVFSVVDGFSEIIASDWEYPDDTMTYYMNLEPSTTYYLVFDNYYDEENMSGNYKFNITYKKDDVGNNKSSAKTVNLNQKVVGTLDAFYDVDCYKIKTGNWKNYTLTLQNINIPQYYFYIKVYSGIDEEVGSIRNECGEIYTEEITLSPNSTYYIKVFNEYYDEDDVGKYSFTLSPVRYDIKDSLMSYKTKYVYTGRTITPTVTVNYKGKILKKGTDYKVSYTNNVKPGTGKITVTGINNYKGTVTLKFKITPKKQYSPQLSNTTKGKIKVTLNKDKVVAGYQIQYATNPSFKGAKTVKLKGYSNIHATLSATRGKTYYVRVRAYGGSAYQPIYGAWSNVKTIKIKK